jgi:hypothetical protein
VKKYFTILLSILTLIACKTGYKKENDKWVWVSYDEAAGKRITEIESADFETFQVLSNSNYAIDKNNVYYMTSLIKKANPKTFTIINEDGYTKDDKIVFLDWEEIIFADPETFEILTFPYSKDKKNVYCGTIPLNIPLDEFKDFTVTNEDKLMSSTGSTILKRHFIETNTDYNWLDTLDIDGVITYEFATAKTNKRKFKGHRQIINDN